MDPSGYRYLSHPDFVGGWFSSFKYIRKMNGACQDEDWCYFESAMCTQFFMKMTHLNIEKKV